MVGHKAKMHHAKRHAEKIQMKKQLKAHDERNVKQKDDGAVQEGALPTYLLDREGQKVCWLFFCHDCWMGAALVHWNRLERTCSQGIKS